MKLPHISFCSSRAVAGVIAGLLLALPLAVRETGTPAEAPPGTDIESEMGLQSAAPPLARMAGPGWRIQEFRTESSLPWSPEMASPMPNAHGGGYTFAHFKDHYTAEIRDGGISLRFGGATNPDAAPFALSLRRTGGDAEARPRSNGDRVEIDRGNRLTEWYRNSEAGVEQGFTLQQPLPGQTSGHIRLELGVPSGWSPVADAGDTSVRFRDDSTGTEIRYQNLLAMDAAGKKLPARLELLEDGSGIAIHTSDAGAVYPVTIDPLLTVVAAANLSPEFSLTFGEEDPLILDDTLNFPIFTASSENQASLGLWRLPLAGPGRPQQTYKYPVDLMGTWNHQLLFSAGGLYSLDRDAESARKVISHPPSPNGIFGPPYVCGPLISSQPAHTFYLGTDGLRQTDGTAAGSMLVRSLPPGTQPYGVMKDDGTLFYVTLADGIYRLNYSGPGPDYDFGTLLSVDIKNNATITLKGAFVINDRIFFFGNNKIYVTDGTIGGTRALADAAYGHKYARMGSHMYFIASGTGQLWRTDGTPEGTLAVLPEVPTVSDLVLNNEALYFRVPGALGSSVWRSDGTSAGTVKFRESAKIASAGGSLFYMLVNTPAEGEELWASDGTAEGTRLLRDITPGIYSTAYDTFRHADNYLLFRAGGKLWRSDGTTEGTVPLFERNFSEHIPESMNTYTAAGNRLFFTARGFGHGTELWSADPATGKIFEVKDINSGADSSPYSLTPFGDGGILFFATQAATGTGLWRSDATAEGTRMVADPPPFTSPVANTMTANGGTAWFVATDRDGNKSLFRTDGTAAGTIRLHTAFSWQAKAPSMLTAFRNGVVFLAPVNDGPPGALFVWSSDGTPEGTVPEPALRRLSTVSRFFPAGNKLFLKGAAPDSDAGLWSAAGTPLILQPCGLSANGYLYPQCVFGEDLFFYRDGEKIAWRSDGTPTGTTAVSFPGSPGRIHSLFAGQTVMYREWRTSQGIALSAFNPDNPGDPAINFSTIPLGLTFSDTASPEGNDSLASLGPLTFFLASKDGADGVWATDGTLEGTSRIPGITPSNVSSSRYFIRGRDELYFQTESPVYGTQLVRISLTAALSVTARPAVGGTVTGSLPAVPEPGLQPISATASAGYYFSRWEGAGITDPLSSVTTVNMREPATVTAIFRQIEPILTAWAGQYGLSGANTGPYAAPAGDGVANLLKYSFNLSPLTSATTLNAPGTDRGLPDISLERDGGAPVLRIEFVRRKSGSIRYMAELSSDLGEWKPSTATPVVVSLNDDWEKVTVSEPLPIGKSSWFGRVRVDLN